MHLVQICSSEHLRYFKKFVGHYADSVFFMLLNGCVTELHRFKSNPLMSIGPKVTHVLGK